MYLQIIRFNVAILVPWYSIKYNRDYDNNYIYDWQVRIEDLFVEQTKLLFEQKFHKFNSDKDYEFNFA